MILTFLTTVWSKMWGYVVAGGAVMALLLGIYLKGRSDYKSDAEVKQVKKNLKDLQEANKIEDAVRDMSESRVDSELSKWMRDDKK